MRAAVITLAFFPCLCHGALTIPTIIPGFDFTAEVICGKGVTWPYILSIGNNRDDNLSCGVSLENVGIFDAEAVTLTLIGMAPFFLPPDTDMCDMRTFLTADGIAGKVGIEPSQLAHFICRYLSGLGGDYLAPLFGNANFVYEPNYVPFGTQMTWLSESGAVGFITMVGADQHPFWSAGNVDCARDPAFSGSGATIPFLLAWENGIAGATTYADIVWFMSVFVGIPHVLTSLQDGIPDHVDSYPNCKFLSSTGFRLLAFLTQLPIMLAVMILSLRTLIVRRKSLSLLVGSALVIEGVVASCLRAIYIVTVYPRYYVPLGDAFGFWMYFTPLQLSTAASILTAGALMRIVSRPVSRLPSLPYSAVWMIASLVAFVIMYIGIRQLETVYSDPATFFAPPEGVEVGDYMRAEYVAGVFSFTVIQIIALALFVAVLAFAIFAICQASKASAGGSGSKSMVKVAQALSIQLVGTILCVVFQIISNSDDPADVVSVTPFDPAIAAQDDNQCFMEGYFFDMLPGYGFCIATVGQLAVLTVASSSSSSSS